MLFFSMYSGEQANNFLTLQKHWLWVNTSLSNQTELFSYIPPFTLLWVNYYMANAFLGGYTWRLMFKDPLREISLVVGNPSIKIRQILWDEREDNVSLNACKLLLKLQVAIEGVGGPGRGGRERALTFLKGLFYWQLRMQRILSLNF